MVNEYLNFLTEEECNLLIAMGESGSLNPGRLSNGKLGYRKAQVRWFESNTFISKIKEKVSELSNTNLEQQERFHFVKYAINGEYKPHYDGKDRCKTALIYLNDGFKGGETYFPNIDRKIKPEIGKLIIWDNIDANGDNDKDSFHAGLPVEFGTKYIAVIWIEK